MSIGGDMNLNGSRRSSSTFKSNDQGKKKKSDSKVFVVPEPKGGQLRHGEKCDFPESFSN